MPANRSQIHLNKVEEFKAFLRRRGWTIVEPKGYYEVLRARHPEVAKPVIFYWRNGTDHLTVMYGMEAKLAAQFIGERRAARNLRTEVRS